MGSPYTHPSMPGTPPMMDLSAALEDAEGRKLAQDIIDRKKYRNAVETFLQQVIWGDVRTDGHGNAIPREEPWYWQTVAAAMDGHRDAKLTFRRGLNRPAVLSIDPAGGPESIVMWTDEHLMTHETGFRRPLASFIRVGGRGYGKTAAIEALRKWNSRPEAFIPHKAPDVGEIRWGCRRPTAPVYAIGTPGWLQIEANARLIAERAHDNRKLNAQMAAKVSAIHDILGATPHDSNRSQVPEDARHC